jgi:hypothetical protein
MSGIFLALTAVAPVTGTYGAENTPKAIKALLSIGKRRPAVMKALVKFADGADSMEIAQFGIGLVVALQVDLQRVAPDSLPARVFGVTAVMDKYFVDDTQTDSPNLNVMGQVPASGPRFESV